ncbi:hypothetical protein N9L68_04350 [bacterium]|nr:hypothetical protein [bacterium]
MIMMTVMMMYSRMLVTGNYSGYTAGGAQKPSTWPLRLHTNTAPAASVQSEYFPAPSGEVQHGNTKTLEVDWIIQDDPCGVTAAGCRGTQKRGCSTRPAPSMGPSADACARCTPGAPSRKLSRRES